MLAFLYYKLNLEKEDLEQSTKRLRDESAQFNAEQYKLKRLLSERERQLRTLMEEEKEVQKPEMEVATQETPEELSIDNAAQESREAEIPFDQEEGPQTDFQEKANRAT